MSLAPRQERPALLQIDAILSRLSGRQALAEVCRFLRHEFLHYRWVGVYRREENALVLVGWDGESATEHIRIPIEKGICGQAAREARTVIVPDVRVSPEYLACFLDTRAEIVVPIREDGHVVGEIDIDGNEVDAFDGSDQRFLETVARRLVESIRISSSLPTVPGSGSPLSS